jgi:hypothetical protein
MSLRLIGDLISVTDRSAQKSLALIYTQDALRRIKSSSFWMDDLFTMYRDNSPDWSRLCFVLSTKEFSHGVLIWLEDTANGWRVSEYFLITMKDALNDKFLLELLFDAISNARMMLRQIPDHQVA